MGAKQPQMNPHPNGERPPLPPPPPPKRLDVEATAIAVNEAAAMAENLRNGVAMRLIPIGRTVIIGNDIDGVVIGINITGSGVQYQVAWWNGRTRSAEWLFPFEILDSEPPTLKIGFK